MSGRRQRPRLAGRVSGPVASAAVIGPSSFLLAYWSKGKAPERPEGAPRPWFHRWLSDCRLLDRIGGEVPLLEERPVLGRGVVLVVRDRVLGGVAVGVEADLAEDRVVRVTRVSDVRADRL